MVVQSNLGILQTHYQCNKEPLPPPSNIHVILDIIKVMLVSFNFFFHSVLPFQFMKMNMFNMMYDVQRCPIHFWKLLPKSPQSDVWFVRWSEILVIAQMQDWFKIQCVDFGFWSLISLFLWDRWCKKLQYDSLQSGRLFNLGQMFELVLYLSLDTFPSIVCTKREE